MTTDTERAAVVAFIWDRLPLAKTADTKGRVPCLQEDWFVEEALSRGSQFEWRGRDAETSHRMLYRYARTQAHKRGEFGGEPHWLLLHQMVELLPAMLAAGSEQRS